MSAKLPFPLANPTKQTIVGADKVLFRAFNHDWTTAGSHAGINYRDVNCAGRKVSVCREQIERRGVDILRRNFVCDVDNLGGGIDREDYSLHRADKIILCAEVGE